MNALSETPVKDSLGSLQGILLDSRGDQDTRCEEVINDVHSITLSLSSPAEAETFLTDFIGQGTADCSPYVGCLLHKCYVCFTYREMLDWLYSRWKEHDLNNSQFKEQVAKHFPLLQENLRKKTASMPADKAETYIKQAETIYQRFTRFMGEEDLLDFIQEQINEYILVLTEEPTVAGAAISSNSRESVFNFFRLAVFSFRGRNGNDAIRTRYYGFFQDGRELTDDDSNELVVKARQLASESLSKSEAQVRQMELLAKYSLTAVIHEGDTGGLWGGTPSGVVLWRAGKAS